MPVVESTLDDWQVSYGGLTIGAGTPYRLVPPLDGLQDYPDVRTGDQPRLRRHGLIAGADFLGGRSVTWQVRVTDRDPAAFAAAWSTLRAAWTPGASVEAPLSFQVPGVAGGGTRRIVGRPRRLSMSVDQYHRLGTAAAVIQFECSDPRIYDDAEQALSTGLAASVPGLSWPLSWDLSWGGLSTSNTVTVTNAGTFDTPWSARIDGPVTNPSIENVDTGQILAFAADGGLTLGDGEFLIVDADTRTALLNGTASRYNTLASPVSWWDLPPGDTALRFGGSTTGSPTLTVTWRSAWI